LLYRFFANKQPKRCLKEQRQAGSFSAFVLLIIFSSKFKILILAV
jgi:hypothetical protein